jgi:hypothetical protein
MSVRQNCRDLNVFPGRQSTRIAMLVLTLSLAFLSGCSSSSTPCPGTNGTYNIASLGASGTQWAYEVSGWLINSSGGYSPYTSGGVFTINGNGGINGGTDAFWGTITGGTYTINSSGTGTVILSISTNAGSKNLVWGITLGNSGTTNSSGSFAVIQSDTLAKSAGAAYQQNPSTLNTAPSGTYVFHTHTNAPGTSITGAQNSVGSITFGTGAVTGNDDWVSGGGTGGQTLGFSGVFTTPSAGIGSITFADGLGLRTFDYFPINANTLLLYETDVKNKGGGVGRAEAQQTPTGGFTNASLSGGYAFVSRGDTNASGAGGVSSAGQFVANGNGNITGGSLDSVRDGTTQIAQTISASTYSFASAGRINGRATATFPTSGGNSIATVLYFVSPTRAFFIVTDDPTVVADGTASQQSTSSFTASSFNGNYTFVTDGTVSGVPRALTGIVASNGNGVVGWSLLSGAGGTLSVCAVGTYTVAANGRLVVSLPTATVPDTVVFYLISPGLGYAIQVDTGTQMVGGVANQNHLVTPYIPGTL